MRFDTFAEAELAVKKLETKVAELEAALDYLHRGATKGSCCEPSAYNPESHDGGG